MAWFIHGRPQRMLASGSILRQPPASGRASALRPVAAKVLNLDRVFPRNLTCWDSNRGGDRLPLRRAGREVAACDRLDESRVQSGCSCDLAGGDARLLHVVRQRLHNGRHLITFADHPSHHFHFRGHLAHTPLRQRLPPPTAAHRANISGNNGSVTGYSRPNLVGDPHAPCTINGVPVPSGTIGCFFNPGAFAVPSFSFGSAGRHLLRNEPFLHPARAL